MDHYILSCIGSLIKGHKSHLISTVLIFKMEVEYFFPFVEFANNHENQETFKVFIS